MLYQSKKEKLITKKFIKNGYIILKLKDKKSLNYIKNNLVNSINNLIPKKKKNIKNLNYIHNSIKIDQLNNFRVKLIKKLNNNKNLRFHYFNLARDCLYTLVGNELLMQKKINLSIQFPNDDS